MIEKKNIIICDIDGTISRVGDRLKYLKQTPTDWDAFYSACFDDEPIKEICELVDNLRIAGYEIIFCTGRRASVYEQTDEWIYKHVYNSRFVQCRLLMRPNNDFRHDVEVKPELLQRHLTDEERARIAFILEDRDCMVAKWRELGYRCLQVDKGEF